MAENTPFEFNVTMTRGDARTIPLEFYEDDDTTPEDITLWEFFYTAKKSLRDSDENAAITLDPLDLVPYDTNKVDIPITEILSKIPPGEYKQDIQVKNFSGTFTAGRGLLVIEDEVTERTAALP